MYKLKKIVIWASGSQNVVCRDAWPGSSPRYFYLPAVRY